MANRYFVNGGVDNNWGSTSNWSLTSGGAGGQTVPTSSDDVFFDASSPDCTVNASNRSAKTLTCTGYTGTLTMTFNIAVSGAITLAAGMTITGAGYLTWSVTSTFTSNGCVVPYFQTNGGNGITYTLGDTINVSGRLIVGSGINTHTINGNGFNVTGDLRTDNQTSTGGTSTLTLSGTGTWDTQNTAGGSGLGLSLIINTAGTITFAAQTLRCLSITYTAGTVITAGSTLVIRSTSTLDINGIALDNLNMGYSGTATLSSNIQGSGLLSLGTGSNPTVMNGNQIQWSGSVRYTGSVGIVQGTTTILLNGTGTLNSLTAAGGGAVRNTIIITTAGTITFSGPFPTENLVYNSGTIAGAGSTIIIAATASYTFNAPITGTWGSFFFNNSTPTATFAGNGITMEGILSKTNATMILVSGETYTVTNGVACLPTVGANFTLRSTTSSSAVNLNVTGDTILIANTNFTDIDASGGNALTTSRGTLTRTSNITSGEPLVWPPYSPPFIIGVSAMVF